MRVLAIIAGASRWPECPSLGQDERFSRSAETLADVFLEPDGLHLRRAELCWLFDDERPADQLDQRLGAWLDERAREDAFNGAPTDVIFYYVGHGHLKEERLFLTVRSTREENIEQSSWSADALARTLREHAPTARKHVILDCCHAAGAVRSFQIPDEAGISLLCGVEKFALGIAREKDFLTSFSDAFISAVTTGLPNNGDRLSLAELCEMIRPALRAVNSPEPSLVDAAVRGSPVSRVKIFPNRATAKPATADLIRRELYRRLLELEKRIEQRIRLRTDEFVRQQKAIEEQIEKQIASFREEQRTQMVEASVRLVMLQDRVRQKVDNLETLVKDGARRLSEFQARADRETRQNLERHEGSIRDAIALFDEAFIKHSKELAMAKIGFLKEANRRGRWRGVGFLALGLAIVGVLAHVGVLFGGW